MSYACRFKFILWKSAALTVLLGSPTVLGQVLTAPCLDPTVPLPIEEARLTYRLPNNEDPSFLQQTSFAEQMIQGAGFQDFGPSVVRQLCGAPVLTAAREIAMQNGAQLWRTAVDRAQLRGREEGNLPYSDDRPLYWARLQTKAALRQWMPRFELSADDRTGLIRTFDRASRGMFGIEFPAGKGVKRLIVSGFDPYTLDGGSNGTAPGAAGNNIRHGNPSGAAALSLDGTHYKSEDGKLVFIEAYILPVNFPEFKEGYLEDTIGPFMLPGNRQVNASVTVSQAAGSQFNLEEWNARYHGILNDNGNFRPCPSMGNPVSAIQNNECNIAVVEDWGGPGMFDLFDPPQWTESSLPIAEMIAANTGASVPRPPGDTWPDTTVAFGVIWNTTYTVFPDCESNALQTFNSPVPAEYPPRTPPIPPAPNSCSYSGGGGNYLANESAYRETLLRDRIGIHIPAGHIHTPDMQHFETMFNPSDETFDAWRLAIIEQTQNLIYVVGNNAP